MKPDCRRVLSQIASYSVEELSPDDADAFTRHLEACPPCKGQWLLFEKTLFTLSQTTETEVSLERSQKMWLTCLEHVQSAPKTLPQNSAAQVEVTPQPFRPDSSGREGDRRISIANRNNFGWLARLSAAFSPRAGYALAGAAAAILAAAYFLPVASQNPAPRVATTLPAMTVKAISFQTPPHATTGMIDYHSAMAFEPFSDHVAPTLVSTTATQP